MGYKPRPGRTELRPSGWGWLRRHSTHGDLVPVDSVAGAVVAHLCPCGEQLPAQVWRDPDGWIVDASWTPASH